MLVFTDERNWSAAATDRALRSLQGMTLAALPGYSAFLWSDLVSDRTQEISAVLLEFLGQIDKSLNLPAVHMPESKGEREGILYRIEGTGPPLVLLPLGLAPSQWEPLLPVLKERYCTIHLGGAELGFAAILEARGRSLGYLDIVRSLIDEARLQPGQTVLDVGCGTGILTRWLVHQTGGANPVTGVDINSYLLREATALAESEGLEVEFREGNAESLPFPDNRFDAAISCTVLEEVNADRTIGEMRRVAKPGGKIAAVVRGTDMPWWVNIPLRAELKAKLEAPYGGVSEGRCGDASLYQRFRKAGLADVRMFPQWASFDESPEGLLGLFLQNLMTSHLSPQETAECRKAIDQAMAEGTFFFSWPHHCAVGTKP
jgi:SAM-dependent methyltransferase